MPAAVQTIIGLTFISDIFCVFLILHDILTKEKIILFSMNDFCLGVKELNTSIYFDKATKKVAKTSGIDSLNSVQDK